MKYISIGPNCHSAGCLKLLKLKESSYPFDWMLSDIKIVIDCIEDNFVKFLNTENYYTKTDDKKIYHKYYNNLIFVHRDPTTENDYSYTLRCVERWNNLQYCNDEICFLYTTYRNNINIEQINILHGLLIQKFSNIRILIFNYIKVDLVSQIKHEYIENDIYTIINIYIVYDNSIEYDIDKHIMNYHTLYNPIRSLYN
uniref:Papain-like cysteine peptidase n=1 Tax=viral metagenome TaxID=1070528 RepID=A0A6C0IIS9_9ZZZZ